MDRDGDGEGRKARLYRHALIVGKFAPLHAGHRYLIETALGRSARLTVLVYSNPDFPSMPQQLRAGWVRSLYPTAHVHVPDGAPRDDAGDEVQRAFVRDYLARSGVEVDVVFSSEDYGPGFAAVLGAAHEMVDRLRLAFPVSGTAVRRDPAANAGFLSPPVRAHMLAGVDFGRDLH